MPKIAAAVGLSQPNTPSDVKTVQSLLNRNALSSPGRAPLAVDGICGKQTLAAIDAFQKHALHFPQPDSIVAANGPTLRLLAAHSVPPPIRRSKPPRHPTSQPPETPAARPNPTTGTAPPVAANPQSLSDDDYVNAAHELHCEAAAIKAIAATETGAEGAFDSQGRPSILFERHYFHRLTQGRFDKSDPDISNPHAGGYGRFSEQYPKLDRAIKLDRDAALKSASWGKFQIMGDNYKEAGYSSVGAFVDAEKRSVQDHLSALVSYIKADPAMLRSLQQKDWAGFASRYNGPNYRQNDYDTKMRQNYEKFTRSP
jgi:hypothetical protein